MNNLKITEYKDIRVLTTQQIAEAYGTNTDTITKNFNRNKERYIEGKHFVCLKGQELREFKTKGQIDLSLKLNKLYLWTQKGAFLHAKSLNTDTAWEVYDRLVDNYFESQPETNSAIQDLSPQLQLLINMELRQKEQSEKLAALEEKSNKQTEALQTVKKAMIDCGKEENFGKWVTQTIGLIANAPEFEENPFRYQTARAESYKRLIDKAGCNLDLLVKNARKRAEERGATKTKVKSISKLAVITEDKRLKALYISVIREMLIAYQVEVA